jgi:PiT family inorganic phosphate transporter
MAVLVTTIVIGLYMAWNIGANDVANAMGTSVGSRSLTFRQAVVVAAIFEFAGAVLVGTHVSETVRKGIVDPMHFASNPQLLVIGMFAALLASALWLNVATYFGQPVSTTHSIVGSVCGVGIIAGGAVKWGMLGGIVASWLISPVASGIIAFLTFRFITRRIFGVEEPGRAVEKHAPYFVVIVAFILTLSFIYKGLKNLHLNCPLPQALIVAVAVSAVAGVVSHLLFKRTANHSRKRVLDDEYDYVESRFKHLQIVTASYVAFAHGANDVANAVGPMAAVAEIHRTGEVAMTVAVPMWILLMGGVGIVLGLTTFGRRVIETIGRRITEITPSRGFAAQIAAATTVLVCSRCGLPVSTTHALVGAVIGVGLARGIAGLRIRTVQQILSSWVATIPITAGLTMLIFAIAKRLFLRG